MSPNTPTGTLLRDIKIAQKFYPVHGEEPYSGISKLHISSTQYMGREGVVMT
jgi:hypothetical protein